MSDPLTLDPSDWAAFRALAHRMVDDSLDHLVSLRERPVWQPVPDASRRALDEPLPRAGQGAEAAYDAFVAHVLPYSNGNRHPRFFGWAQGNGTPLGMMADMLAAGMNPHVAGFAQAPALVEEQVLRWLIEVMGFPPAASGVLVLGGSMAGLLGLAVARHARAGFEVGAEGLAGGPRLCVYASQAAHHWVTKAVELLGLGRAGLRRIATDPADRVDLSDLRAQIAADRGAGRRPICVVGTAGTVGTGAIDDLEALADLCAREGLWLHVDGAFGALARLSRRLAPLVRGIERADSLAFDLHKWMYQPFDVACVLVRDAELHRAAFAASASYVAPLERGVSAGGLPFADRGVDLTRSFRALKVWLALKAHGVDAIAAVIEQNVEQARALARRIAAEPELELLAEVVLSVVCFRFRRPGLAEPGLDALNQELLLRVQESGLAVPSSARVRGRFALRCAFFNHRTRPEDLDLLVDAVLRAGRALAP